jgi:hypothetical protein
MTRVNVSHLLTHRRTYFAEAVIWESFSTLSTVPTSPEAQQTFGLLVGLLSVHSPSPLYPGLALARAGAQA